MFSLCSSAALNVFLGSKGSLVTTKSVGVGVHIIYSMSPEYTRVHISKLCSPLQCGNARLVTALFPGRSR